MSTPARQDCANALRALIDRADEDGFGAAQNLLLRYALSHADPERRAETIDALRADLGDDDVSAESTAQRAFRAALLAMIERTKLTVGPESGRGADL